MITTQVEQQQPVVAAVAVEENGVAPVTETTAIITTTTNSNGDAKTEKKNGAVKKEPEPPKDPKIETTGWLNQQHKLAVHKANDYVYNWAANEAYAEDDKEKPAPSKDGYLTRRQFVSNLKDGVILARVANKYQPGAAEPVKEGEEAKTKENQEANVNVFRSVAKQFVPEDQLITHEDLEKGKESYPKVFTNLFHVMINSPPEHFKVPGGNFQQFIDSVGSVSTQKFWQKILSTVNNAGDYINSLIRRPFQRSNSTQAEPEQNGAAPNGVATNGIHTTEIAVHEENGVKIEEKKEEIITNTAVVAN